MKKLILLITSILTAPLLATAQCYLLIDGQHHQSPSAIQEISLMEISRYVEPVAAVPPEGISGNDCVYHLTLSEVGERFLLVIKGPRLNSYAESDQPGFTGFQQALFRSIIKEYPSLKPDICKKNQPVLTQECGQVADVAVAVDTDLLVYDSATRLTWQKEESGKMDWDAAKAYCNSLDFAQHTDWRLPNRRDLKSSYPIKFRFTNPKNYYWSADATDKHYAWALSMGDGEIFSDWIKNHYFVRCVRGEELPAVRAEKLSAEEASAMEQEPVDAEDDNQLNDPTGMRWTIAPTYVSGFNRVYELYVHNLEEQGYTIEEDDAPLSIGIAFRPYYQMDSGLRIGTGIGPFMYILAESGSEKTRFSALPIDITAGYTLPNGIFFRGGFSKLNAEGEYVVSENLGIVGLAGMEFNRHRKVSIGFEAGIDSSSVVLERFDCSHSSTPTDLSTCDSELETVMPVGFSASFLVIF